MSILDREPRYYSSSICMHHLPNCRNSTKTDTATVGRVKICRDDKAHGKSVRLAKHDFINGTVPSIRSGVRTYNREIACMDCNSALKHVESISYLVQEEEAIVRFRETFDDWVHPVN